MVFGEMKPILWKQKGSELSDQCPICYEKHDHGNVEGYRMPHCDGKFLTKFEIRGHVVDPSLGYYYRIYDPLSTKELLSTEKYFRKSQSASSQISSDDIMDIKMCSKFILKSEATVRKYIRLKSIPFYKKEGSIYFFKSEILNWIKDGKR